MKPSKRLSQAGAKRWLAFQNTVRAVTKILKCQVNTTRRRGIKVVLSFLYREGKSSCAMVANFSGCQQTENIT